MTENETRKIMALVAAAYQNFKLPPSPVEMDMMVNSWHLTLGDLPYDLVSLAMLDYQRSPAEFPPTAGQLRHLAIDRAAVVPSREQAWTMVLDHLRRHSYLDNTPLAAPAPVVDAVRALGGLGSLRRSETPEMDRSHFFKVYDSYRERALRDVGGDLVPLGQHAAAMVGAGE